MDELPEHKVVMICTGSQGEPLSALSRMANRDHRIRITDGDVVVLASSLVPGNENAVHRVINGLSRWGAHVIHKGIEMVHVSGHAPAGELLYVLNVTKPSNLMPIHGEWRHLRAHAELAGLTGMRRDDVVLADNGVVVDLVDGRAQITGALPCGYVYVDGAAVGDVGEASLKDRRILGDEGFVTITVVVDASTGKVVGGPELSARGFTDDLHVFDDARMLVENALAQAAAEGRRRAQRAAADRSAHGRPVGERHVPPPPDDPPGRHRGLAGRADHRHQSLARGTASPHGRGAAPGIRSSIAGVRQLLHEGWMHNPQSGPASVRSGRASIDPHGTNVRRLFRSCETCRRR